MDVILAENLTGWVKNALEIFAWIGALVLSLIALVPALFGRFKITLGLAMPSLIFGAAIVVAWSWACAAGHPPADKSHVGDLMWETLAYGWFLPALPSAIGICALCLASFFRFVEDQKNSGQTPSIQKPRQG